MNIKTALLAAIALIAFAGNSVLCRLALANHAIDPASFTSLRLVSGAVVLLLLLSVKSVGRTRPDSGGQSHASGWLGPATLFVYAAFFSFAYLSLDTGVGALVLFGTVQITMIAASVYKGSRLGLLEILGLLCACSGLVYLLYPELSTPSVKGFVLMMIAGVAWGAYTINGQGSTQPLRDTSSNFSKSVPLALLLAAIFFSSIDLSWEGMFLAFASGAITSGLGYAIWYAALPGLNTSQAGVIQLLVPVIAALGGVLFANEVLSSRLIISAGLTLGGILLVMRVKTSKEKI